MAQGLISGRLYLGAKASYGSVDFSSTNNNVENFAERTYKNISYGAVAGYKLTSSISIQVEGLYTQYSGNSIKYDHLYSENNPLLTSSDPNSSVDHIDMDLYYFDIPVIAKYHLVEGAFSPYIYAGINWGINTSDYTTITRKYVDNNTTLYREFTDEIFEQIKYNDMAPIIGAGFNVDLLGKISAFGDFRFKYGVKNISNVQNGLGFRNNALWLSAGLVYNL